ncbi:MAG TPA: polyprenyl diphosphate synthase, partial [Woeseiaceae bacterium]|nr:polyprenyl diphosphate synthase [Woeseiaceae bacterium]
MHVAIIMDGNGRWAERRGLARSAGHRAGARAVRRVVEAAARSAVETLTLYAFSSDNWCRPDDEVASLMRLLKRYLISETARCVENGVRINVVGRRDRLEHDLVRTIEQTERATATGTRLVLQLAVDYSARDAIVRAAGMTGPAPSSRESFEEQLNRAIHVKVAESRVDLLIRTGGEHRLSDFLLWECAYAELLFVDTYWPDFDEHAFAAALREFDRRDRRYGGLSTRS